MGSYKTYDNSLQVVLYKCSIVLHEGIKKLHHLLILILNTINKIISGHLSGIMPIEKQVY